MTSVQQAAQIKDHLGLSQKLVLDIPSFKGISAVAEHIEDKDAFYAIRTARYPRERNVRAQMFACEHDRENLLFGKMRESTEDQGNDKTHQSAAQKEVSKLPQMPPSGKQMVPLIPNFFKQITNPIPEKSALASNCHKQAITYRGGASVNSRFQTSYMPSLLDDDNDLSDMEEMQDDLEE